MKPIVPTLGRVVLYCLLASEAEAINRTREDGLALGNYAREGDVFPADIVRVWGDPGCTAPETYVNLQVKLDGNDTLWATSRSVSDGPQPGHYHWMPYQLGQAAKTEDAERALSAAELDLAISRATSGEGAHDRLSALLDRYWALADEEEATRKEIEILFRGAGYVAETAAPVVYSGDDVPTDAGVWDFDHPYLDVIARVAHEVNRAYCDALGDSSQPPWEQAPEWQRESARMGVDLHCSGNFGPEASHISWMSQKLAAGWKYGPVKDPEAKQHPCLVPFDQLPREQQAKDFLFRAVVHALRPTAPVPSDEPHDLAGVEA